MGFLTAGVLYLSIAGTALGQIGTRLEQASNGTPAVPVSAAEWVTTTITAQQGHYVEHSSIPYRLVLEAMLPGAHRVMVAWDRRDSGGHATDYLTHFNRLQPHNQFGAHSVPETIQPLRGISGQVEGPFAFAIPGPGLAGSSFYALPSNQRTFEIYNGTITAAAYASEGTGEHRMAIDFVASRSPVIILFGGHIAAKQEWGAGQTASGVSGAEYRMRVAEIDGLPSLLNVAVAATAVVAPPTCAIAGADAVCPARTNVYRASTDATNAIFNWTLIGNTAGASFIGGNAGPEVLVHSGNGGGSYTLQVSIDAGPLHSTCAQTVMVWTNTSLKPLANTSVCPGGTATFGTTASGTGPFTFQWRKGNDILEGETNTQLVLTQVTAADAGAYCVEVTGRCDTVTSCATLTVLSNTTATPLPNLSRCVGEGAVFSTIPAGTGPFTYRWRKNGFLIPGQTNRILSIPNLSLADAGVYSVEVTGLCNSITNAGRLTVHPLPFCGIQGPSSICPQSSGSVFTAPTNMAGYRWRVVGNGMIVGPTNEQSVVVTASTAGFLTLYLTVVNSNGCSRSCSQTITVGDIEPPVVVCPGNIQTNTESGQCSQIVEFAVSAADDCNGTTITCNPASGTRFQKGTTTVNCAVVDGAGNQAGCSFDVTVVDLERPVLSCPANLTISTQTGVCEAAAAYNVTASDNCPGTTVICSPPSGTVFPLGTSGVTCRASDSAGNVEFCTFDVTVIDNEAPRISCPPDLAFVTDPGQCDVIVDYQVDAGDNCAMASLACIPPSGSLFSAGTTTVICVARDISQNMSECSFEVRVEDVENPRMVCPGDITATTEPGRCDALVNFTYKTGDNCRTVDVTCVPPSGSRFAVGQTNVVCTATDGSGNRTTCTFAVTVTDNERPTLSCPPDMSVNMETGRCDAVVPFTVNVTDNCPGAQVSCVPASGSVFLPGLTVVNCIGTDASSNAVACAFNVTVQDTESPQIFCPGAIVTNAAPGECTAVVEHGAFTTDNCSGAEIYCDWPSEARFPIGETIVYCVAVDTWGNVADCLFSVIVNDVEPPVISCPPDLTLNTETSRCDAVASFAVPASDNCGAPVVTCVPPSGSAFPMGVNTVNCSARDGSGNSAQCAFRVVVEDHQPPSLTCPGSIITNAAPGRCDAVISFEPIATDNCSAVDVVCLPPPGTRFAVGLTTVTCVARDASGNTNRCSFFVGISDDEPPVVACPANIVVFTEPGACDAPVSFAAAASDNCAVASNRCVPPSGSRFSKGTTRVECTARDTSGHEETCAFVVTVVDNEPPAIACPTNRLVSTEVGRCDAVVTFGPSVSDNCAGATVVCVPPSGARFAAGETPVTCTSTDASGNTDQCTFSVIVRDLEQPQVICPEDLFATTEAGQCDAEVIFSAAVLDNCAGATVECVPPSGTRFPGGVTIVACTATDASGNAAACAFRVTVDDAEPPAVICSTNIVTYTASGRCDAEVTFASSVEDNCAGASVVCSPGSGATFAEGVTVVRCIGRDLAGNTNECSFTVTVEDREKPVIVCPQPLQLFTAAGACDAIGVFEASATDNCGAVTTLCSPPTGSRFAQGITTVTCTATDNRSNSATCSFPVTVRDLEPPLLTCPTNMVFAADAGRCDAVVSFAPTVIEECPGATVVCAPPSGTRFLLGATRVDCTAADASSNSVTCSFIVRVEDNERPRMVCPDVITTNTAPGRCDAVVQFAVPATDNCGGTEVVCEPASGSLFSIGTNTVICTAIDSSENVDGCAFVVVVVDDENPSISCPANIGTNTEPGRCDALVAYSAGASDNCSEAALLCEPPSGSRFAAGMTMVTCTATDPSGNTANCTFSVAVGDHEPPTVNCPQDLVLSTEAGMCSARGTFAAQVTDNCEGATVVCAPPSGAEFSIGVTTVICRGTDSAGNAQLCAFEVRVNDGEPPRLLCPGDLIVDTEPTQCTATVAYDVTGEDACSLTNLVCTPPSGSLFTKGVTLVQCSARDASGNEATCGFSVTVRDTEAPAFLCPTNVVAAATPGRCDAFVDFAISASDNCNGATIICMPPSGSTFSLGTTFVTCRAFDSAGNTNQCAFTVRVIDTQRPVLTCPGNLTVNAEANRCDAVVTFTASVADNCGAMSLSCTPPSGTRFNLGSTLVTCSSVDGAGNVGTCSFTVTVRDTQPPVVQCPGNITSAALAGRCDAAVAFNASATDNCGSVNVSCFPPSGSYFSLGVTTVNCSSFDGSFNLGTCQFTVTVRDMEAPSLQCPADILVNTVTGRCDAVVSFSPQASDDCSSASVTCVPPSGSSFLKGTNHVTCTARDLSSNAVNCTFRVIVRDVQKPQIICPSDIVANTDADECRARVKFSATATDNCIDTTVACTPPSDSFFNRGVTTVICVATDSSGNTNRCSFSVTVNDTVPPTIVCPVNIATNATQGQRSAVVHFAPTISDNCAGVSHTCTPQSGSVFQEGTTPVNCTVSDPSGNTATCSFSVSVDDTEPPVITCPTNLVLATTAGRCDAIGNYNVTATDNSQMATVVCAPPTGSVLPKGVTEVICTATDPASNHVSCAFTVEVVDVEQPVIACPTSMTLTTPPGRCDAQLTYVTNVTDNCGSATLSCNPPSGVSLPPGTNTVTCTALDSSGNVKVCAFAVQVVDDEFPTIICPGKLVLNTEPGRCDAIATFKATTTDNCPDASVACVPPSGSSFAKGATTVNCTARDMAGNASTCSFQVEVRDVERPVVICPAEIDTISSPGACGVPVIYSASAHDNCPGATLTCTPSPGSMFPIGTNVVTCLGTDTSGNMASCSFRILVRDVERPVITCPADILIDGSNGNCVPIATYNPTVRDNCQGAIVNCVPPSGTSFPQGTNRVTCTASDGGGNMDSCAFSVVVRLQPLTATPLQPQTRCSGESASFTTSASGSGPVTFAWFRDGVSLSGRTSASLLLSNLSLADAGNYSVVVQSPCARVTNSATLTVRAPVTISGMTNVTRCDCDPVALSPVVSGAGPFTYAWRKNGTLLPGATSNTLSFAKLSTNDIGVYTVEVSGACNTATASASVGVITVPNPAVYTNSGAITIQDLAPAFPYPSSVRVACVPKPITRATVTLRGFTHGYPDDVDVLLAAPEGQCVLLMSDAGAGSMANNINITLDGSAAVALPDSTQLFTGSFRPANYDTDADAFPLPAPKVTPAETLSALAGADANGFWSLFVVDDFQLDSGMINNGWVLRLYWETSAVRLTSPRTLPSGGFQMTIFGEPQSTCTIESSPDMITWTTLGTITLTGPQADFTDPAPGSTRFYRARSP